MNIRFYPFAHRVTNTGFVWIGYIMFPQARPNFAPPNYRPVFRVMIPHTSGAERIVSVCRDDEWREVVRYGGAFAGTAVEALHNAAPELLKEAILVLHPDLAERLLPNIQFVQINTKTSVNDAQG